MSKNLSLTGDTALSLDLPKTQTFDEWVDVGRNLASASKVLNWWIGDWWVAGSHRYGERARVAAKGIFGREFQSLMNVASVCRSFETSRRREVLSFGHHEAVASLNPEQADDLLERAEQDGWTVKDIRAETSAFRPARNGSAPETAVVEREWSALVGAWNRARIEVRQRFLDEIDGAGAIE